MSYTIEFTFVPGQSPKVHVQGMQGPACTDLTKFFEAIGTVETQELTAEYHQEEIVLDTAVNLNV